MFIIERRTAGVLAALATTAAVVVLGNVRDPVDDAKTPYTATSTPAFAASGRALGQLHSGQTRHKQGEKYQKFLHPNESPWHWCSGA